MSFFIMFYYCESIMEYKDSKIKSRLIMLLGYIVYCGICMFNITVLNIICGFIINFAIIFLGYKAKMSRIIYQVTVLMVLMMFGELLASLIVNKKINNEFAKGMTFVIEDIIFTVVSKIIYFIFVICFRHIYVGRNSKQRSWEMIWLLILPSSTCMYLIVFNQLYGVLNNNTQTLFIFVGIMLIISTFIVYVVCERIIDKNIRIQYLQSLEYKREMDEKSFQLIKEKYEELRIMAHDFNKYCNNIEGMLSQEQREALTMIQNIKNKSKEFMVVEYTNNSALNVLLSQKMKECNEEQIDFQLYAKDIDLSFINEMDTVAIFANLIDNAIESCRISDKKKIFFSINIMNSSYIVVRVDNSADTEPLIVNNHIATIKQDKEKHGIGLSSIQKSLAKYGGSARWTYDKDTHTFTTTILINISERHVKI